MPIERVVSGGQTGVDRAALDVARELDLEHGGWCPRGGGAEDLPDPPGLLVRYPGLRETPSSDPAQRTRWNVRDSDATLVVLPGPVASAGTDLTVRSAQRQGRPLLVVDPTQVASTRRWLAGLAGTTLNVAGPRESEVPGIRERTASFLRSVLAPVDPPAAQGSRSPLSGLRRSHRKP